MSDVEGNGWRLVRPSTGTRTWVPIDALLPDADWFWLNLRRDCVPECCGLDAYDFSSEVVAWACGWGSVDPGGIINVDPTPGDVPALVAQLRAAADSVRELQAEAVSADLFNDILTPASYAELLDELTAKALPKT